MEEKRNENQNDLNLNDEFLIENLIDLKEINEQNLTKILKCKYDKGLIYTFIGKILLAINPYRLIDNYGINEVKRYENYASSNLPAHLFATSSLIYSKFLKNNENQFVVVNGLSGSGKTESIKLILQYLVAVNKSPSNIITEQILESNPLLEAFGNAKTIKNNNSSRFSKLIEIYFKDGIIVGAHTTHYLLEKSRIVIQYPEERNYHIFYQVLAALTETEKEKYGLQTADKYFYLNQGNVGELNDKNDAQEFSFLLSSFQVLGFTNEQQDIIFRVLASVLHLGNIYFHRKYLKSCQESVELGSDVEIRWSCHLLQLNIENVLQALTFRVTRTRAEQIITPYNIDQALDARDAIAKTLYTGLFSWLLSKINEKTVLLKSSSHHDIYRNLKSIAVLDLYGFENLNENSFEQLCINYANEKLEQYFTQVIFKQEQIEYQKEKIYFKQIDFKDNLNVINILVKKPIGIFSLLDDECNFPKATDQSFLDKCHYNHALNELYARPRISSFEFGIKHFAGLVWYTADGFLEKNRDALRGDIIELLISSKMSVISKMFNQYKQSLDPFYVRNQQQQHIISNFQQQAGKQDSIRFVTMKPRTPTISARFQESLSNLFQKMSKSSNNSWFICCLNPNQQKKPGLFDTPYMLEQIRNYDLVSVVQSRQNGYPNHKPFKKFVSRFRCLISENLDKNLSSKQICELILKSLNLLNLNSTDYQLGTSRIFFKDKIDDLLEKKREKIICDAVIKIQKITRGYLQKNHLKKQKLCAIKIQSVFRGYVQLKKYTKLKKAAICLQAQWRMLRQKREYKKMLIFLAEKRKLEEVKKQNYLNEKLNTQELLERSSNSVLNLEIPNQLNQLLNDVEKFKSFYNERNIQKLSPDHIMHFKLNKNQIKQLPEDIDQFAFTKFTNIYFRSHVWAMKREPIKTPFLTKNSDLEHHQSLLLFKLILRFMNDHTLTGLREKIFSDYIVQIILKYDYLRDEILCQLCNQTWKNENQLSASKGWLLLCNCLSAFGPSNLLYKYLLKYVSDHAPNEFKGILQQKLLNCQPDRSRKYIPSFLEWIANYKKANMSINVKYSDEKKKYCEIESWTTGEDLANDLLTYEGINNNFGWSVDLLDEDNNSYELNGEDYVFDLISKIENSAQVDLSNPHQAFYNDLDYCQNGSSVDFENIFVAKAKENITKVSKIFENKFKTENLDNLSICSLINEKNLDKTYIHQRHHSLGSLDGEQINLSKNSKLNKRYLQQAKETYSKKLNRTTDKSLSSEGLIQQNSSLVEDLKLSETSKLNKRYTSNVNQSNLSNNQFKKTDELIKIVGGVARRLNKQSFHQNSISSSSNNLNDTKNHTLNKRSISLQELGLATKSALNDRYFESNLNKSNSLSDSDNKLGNKTENSSNKNDSKSNLVVSSSVSSLESSSSSNNYRNNNSANKKNSSVKKELPFAKLQEIKETKAKLNWYKNYGSNSSNMYPNNEFKKKNKIPSSAMSDTSEAPSLASHVKKVKIPSHASELDQYLDDLFNPVLDGNLDELSDARSLAASIKGGSSKSKSSNVQLNSKIEINASQINKLSFENFKSIQKQNLINENDLCQLIKGGSSDQKVNQSLPLKENIITNNHIFSPNSALKAQQKGPPTINTSSINSNNCSQQLPFTNVAGMTVPMVDTSQIIQQQLVHQQMIQRAFLASAVQQNLQIQQQLLQQNQALQQLLCTSGSPASPSISNNISNNVSCPNSLLTPSFNSNASNETLQSMFPIPLLQTVPQLDFLNSITSPFISTELFNDKEDNNLNDNKTQENDKNKKEKDLLSANKKNEDAEKIQILSSSKQTVNKNNHTNQINTQTSTQALSTLSSISTINNAPPPPPPPPPHSPIVYGSRAKTVRIGKWRWPPPRQEGDGCEQKTTNSNKLCSSSSPNQFSLTNQTNKNLEANESKKKNENLKLNQNKLIKETISIEYNEDMVITELKSTVQKETNYNMNKNISLSTNGLNSSDKQSKIVANNSNVGKLRISSEMKAKLEMLTINQSVRSTNKSSSKNDLVAKSMEDIRQKDSNIKKLSEQRKFLLEKQLMGQLNQDKKIACTSVDNLASNLNKKSLTDLNPKLIKNSQNYSRESRERMDELGPNVNKKISKSINNLDHSLHGNNSSASLSALNYCFDCNGKQLKEDFNNCNASKCGFFCDEHITFKYESLNTSASMCNMDDYNLFEQKKLNRRRSDNNLNTNLNNNFKLNHLSKTRYDALNNKNIETNQDHFFTNEIKKMDNSKLVGINSFKESNDQQNAKKIKTKLLPINKNFYLTYHKVPWKLSLRKELFSPAEKIESPMILSFIFCQIVRDAYSKNCLRMNNSEKQSIINQLNLFEINLNNFLNSPQKLTIQKTIVQMARQMPFYFCRFYAVNCLNETDLNQNKLLAISHSGLRLVKASPAINAKLNISSSKNLNCSKINSSEELELLNKFSFDEIIELNYPQKSELQIIVKNGSTFCFHTDKAEQIKHLIEYFILESSKETNFVKAISNFDATEPSFLSFKKGDLIAVSRNTNLKLEKGLFYGIHKATGESGILSSKYVTSLDNKFSNMNEISKNDTSSEQEAKFNQDTDSYLAIEKEEDSAQISWVESKNENSKIIKDEGLLVNSSLNQSSNNGLSNENNQGNFSDGKFSLLQFALFNFVEAIDKYELIQETVTLNQKDKMVETLRTKKKNKKNQKNSSGKSSNWTWKELSDLVKFTNCLITQPLLKHSHNSLNKIAIKCFASIMKYMGDLRLNPDQTEVDCVYNILVSCHKHLEIRDEVYCQLMKQTTNNKSQKIDSCQRGWRLFSIVTAYFNCSDNLRPYLFKYLETTAYDKRRAYHATALVCLQNLRKTLRFGGRKNVPSVEEIMAISAGRNSKRQMYRLPGGSERIVNTKSSTVVNDVIEEICLQLNATSRIEQQEFSLYCIVEGDPYTMPLNRDEYILDITTELIKNGQIFYLIFCRSVWYHPLRLDCKLYIEVIFNQVAPDYLEGLLLVLSSNKDTSRDENNKQNLQHRKNETDTNTNIFADFTLSNRTVEDLCRIAALLHRAADMEHQPTKDEVKYLLPKPILPMKFMKPAKWVELVQNNWSDMSAITTTEAKAQCLDILSSWPLFGSCFFAIKHVSVEYNSNDFPEYILALNRNGTYFLDIITHETIWMHPYLDIISTRKVRAEDGALFLDMKCGNLMQQKVTRIQTDQAHEISRLIRQYIEIQNYDKKTEPLSKKPTISNIQDV